MTRGPYFRRQACRHGEWGARSHARSSRRPDGRARGACAAYYGHKHTYQRTFPIFAGVVTPNNADGSNNGTIYYTAGNAGARARRRRTAAAPWMYRLCECMYKPVHSRG